MAKARFRGLVEHVAALRPELEDVIGAITDGRVMVDGTVMDNPKARVRADAAVVVRTNGALRGEAKLRGALDAFSVDILGRVALDAGASAGGFTRVLLDSGASRVYAVDAGHGQLLGSLRQDPRVVNLEATNVAAAGPDCIPDPIDVVTVDVSYLPLREAVAQLHAVQLTPGAHLVGLVKPMFELALPSLPVEDAQHRAAVERAAEGIAAVGWTILDTFPSAVTGRHGALEWFVHATVRHARPGLP